MCTIMKGDRFKDKGGLPITVVSVSKNLIEYRKDNYEHLLSCPVRVFNKKFVPMVGDTEEKRSPFYSSQLSRVNELREKIAKAKEKGK